MPTATQMTEEFFNYARERYRIKIRRDAGKPWPWTDDPILQQFRFCHVFREDDKTTVWFRENIRDWMNEDGVVRPSQIILAVAGFRWFTLISVGEAIKDVLKHRGWCSTDVKKLLKNWAPPLVTGAYMMTSPHGMNKLDGICYAMATLSRKKKLLRAVSEAESLEEAHRLLMTAPYLGDFRAYEIVTDLRHTRVLEDANDIMTWANPGPGAIRGLNWIYGMDLRRRKRDMAKLQLLMQQLLLASEGNWPEEWGGWEMRDVEHTLCEFDKYMRGRNGERLKRRYQRAGN